MDIVYSTKWVRVLWRKLLEKFSTSVSSAAKPVHLHLVKQNMIMLMEVLHLIIESAHEWKFVLGEKIMLIFQCVNHLSSISQMWDIYHVFCTWFIFCLLWMETRHELNRLIHWKLRSLPKSLGSYTNDNLTFAQQKLQ